MDFAEFEKRKEHFLIIGDKFSGTLHVAGMARGGTAEEAIDEVQNFARSSTKYIRKIVMDRGTQFTSGEFKRWALEENIELQYSIVQIQTNTKRAA